MALAACCRTLSYAKCLLVTVPIDPLPLPNSTTSRIYYAIISLGAILDFLGFLYREFLKKIKAFFKIPKLLYLRITGYGEV